jgi:hypothetical protein
MSNNVIADSVSVTQLPAASNVASTDELVVVFNANSNALVSNGSPSVRIITISNFVNSLGKVIPGPYTNDAAANTAGVSLNSLYYDTTGIVRIRLV